MRGLCVAGEGAYAVAAAREVPEGAEGEVARVLQAVDHYEVLQVPVSADAETLRKAKRSKALGTHPDKLGQAAGANEAFGRVTEVSTLDMACKRVGPTQSLSRKTQETEVAGLVPPL